MKGSAAKLAEEDESKLIALGIPYTIIKAGILQDSPGGQQGFCFEKACTVMCTVFFSMLISYFSHS